MTAIYFADLAMIVHVVPEIAEVSSCGLQNISRVAVQCILWHAGDGRYIYIYNWGEPKRAPHWCVQLRFFLYLYIYLSIYMYVPYATSK